MPMTVLDSFQFQKSLTPEQSLTLLAQLQESKQKLTPTLAQELGEDATAIFQSLQGMELYDSDSSSRWVLVHLEYFFRDGIYAGRIKAAEEFKCKADLMLIIKLENLLNEAIAEYEEGQNF